MIGFPFFQGPYPHGELYFNPDQTAYPSLVNGSTGKPLNSVTGDAMASMLLGDINFGRMSTNNFISSDKKAWAFYAQDDWKVTPRLTVNIGVRYELFSPIGEACPKFRQMYASPTACISRGRAAGK